MKPSKELEAQIDSEKDMEIGAGIWPPKCHVSLNDLAHEIWATAQLLPGEGIEDGVNRLESLLQDSAIGRQSLCLNRLLKAVKAEQEARELADDPGGENELALWRRAESELAAAIKDSEKSIQ